MTSFSISSNPYEDRQALIDNDRAAIWKSDQYGNFVSYDENGEIINEEKDSSHIGVVPYPVGEGGKGGFDSVNGYYIAAQTEVRQAAWEWLKYLTAQESLSQYGLPARISTAESDEYVQRVGSDQASVLIDSVKNSTLAANTNLFSEDNNWLSPALSIGLQEAYNAIIKGDATVEEALQAAQEKADTYRQCIIEDELVGSNDYQAFESCMEKADLSWENG